MYCLDCGTKVEEGIEQCPNCGMTVADMRDRIAHSLEMITYAETVGPDSTSKLPPVAQRTYVKHDGNAIDPKQSVEVGELRQERGDLLDLPDLSGGDPFVTMPIQKIVDEHANVIHDVDREAKVFSQPEERPFNVVPLLVGIIVVMALVIVYLGVQLYL